MRGKMEVDTLLKAILVLAVVWLALEVVQTFVETLQFLFQLLPKLIGLALIVLILLYLLDRI